MSVRDFKSTLFGSIDAGNVDGTIAQLRRAWYVVAALQAALQLLRVWLSEGAAPDLVDPIICALGGYFLGARKSRAVAVLLFLYALAVGAVTLGAMGGGSRGGTGVIMALVVVGIGWRGLQATWTYHRVNELRTAWKHVLAISGVALVASLFMFAAFVFFEIWQPQYVGDETLMGVLVVAAILLSVLAVMWPLTRRYPFAYPEMLGGRQSRDIPQVFD
jgi:hypothetical protein